jgi:hypothetical protein
MIDDLPRGGLDRIGLLGHGDTHTLRPARRPERSMPDYSGGV